MPSAIILSIGDELVSGLTVNTNASWLSAQLTAIGIGTAAHVTVADALDGLVEAIAAAAGKAEFLLITGGLGPTEDDLTRQALATAMGDTLVEDAGALTDLEAWFASRGRVMAGSNRVQALRPTRASCIANSCGTAPGLVAVVGKTQVFVMPGVPREMREMFARSVLPLLKAVGGGRVTLVSKLNTFGMGESALGEKIADLMTRGANPSVGTTVHEGIVSVRVYATGAAAEARVIAEGVKAVVRERLGTLIFGEDDVSIERAVAEILLEKKVTLATAESCTGGMLAEMLTATSGSSAYFLRGWVTYSNEAKVEELGVDAEIIARQGAVSEEVARAMAARARDTANADYALAITGIAGPTGGSADKPVGLVWIGLAGPGGVQARKFIFPGDRQGVRLRASQMALSILRWELLGLAPPV